MIPSVSQKHPLPRRRGFVRSAKVINAKINSVTPVNT
jgi:hypothetical protein